MNLPPRLHSNRISLAPPSRTLKNIVSHLPDPPIASQSFSRRVVLTSFGHSTYRPG
jgi:hypothetical protein